MTEKNYNQEQEKAKTMKQEKKIKVNAPTKKEYRKENKEIKDEEANEKKTEKKQVQKIKKDEAIVNGISLFISTKDSVAICKFIKGKTIDKAIADLEEIEKFKKAIPMTGEIPHRKGKKMMSGRYMAKPVKIFIRMLKNLKANSDVNGLEEPIIAEAVANKASRPYGRFGSVQRKRTHVKIVAKEKNKIKKNK